MKNILYKSAIIYRGGGFQRLNLAVVDNKVVREDELVDYVEVDCSGKYILPGLVDVHVHFREPGFEYKETILTGAAAAARGGYTTVCTMPNLNPAPDTVDNILIQTSAAQAQSEVRVLPYASITKGQKGEGELVDFAALAPYAFAFSDDGRGVQSEDLMRQAMLAAKTVGKHIVAHCEDESLLLAGGCIHNGAYAAKNGLVGISSESEWKQVERDIQLVRETGCKYHICHISTKETVELVRQAKAAGLSVTCETAPHYLLLCDDNLQDDGRFKMNPPLRSQQDKEALIRGIQDGTIDMIATDHAPHSADEKAKGLKGSAFGIVGLEIAFPLMYTYMVKAGIISLERLIELMAIAPRRIFGLDGGLEIGDRAEFAIWDLQAEYRITPQNFLSKGKATPFADYMVVGKTDK